MHWSWFITESKSFLNYENLKFKDKVKFWIRFPYAAIIFYYLITVDLISTYYKTRKNKCYSITKI